MLASSPRAPRQARNLAHGVAFSLAIAVLAVETSACFGEPADQQNIYERCHGSDGANCADGSECLSLACCGGQICTMSCANDVECPAVDGFEVACESFDSGRRCVVRCNGTGDDAGCPGELECNETTRENGELVSTCH